MRQIILSPDELGAAALGAPNGSMVTATVIIGKTKPGLRRRDVPTVGLAHKLAMLWTTVDTLVTLSGKKAALLEGDTVCSVQTAHMSDRRFVTSARRDVRLTVGGHSRWPLRPWSLGISEVMWNG